MAKLYYRLDNNVYYCNHCELYFAPDTSFNHSFESSLDETSRTSALKELRLNNFIKIIKELKNVLPEDAFGLEVGSSYGWFLEIAKANGIDCIGIEPEHTIWNYANNKGLKVIKGFFPDDLPIDNNQFDFIIFNDVFEHIPEVEMALQKCRELLKPNGILIINLPQSTGIFYKIAHLLYKLKIKTFLNRLWQFNFHSPHFYYFNKNSIENILRRNKLSVFLYHRLDTLTKGSIENRITSDKKAIIYVKPISLFIKLAFPILNHLNEDIGCYYAKKI
jgi:2-polyprenyl-3-methyl-5-hydroxy-6-metoxy-1,4-benzoquinol methylase